MSAFDTNETLAKLVKTTPAHSFEDVALGTVRRDTSSISSGVPAFWFTRALEPGQMASMWRPFAQSTWVSRCIKIISGPISAVKPDLYPRQASPNSKAGTPRRRVRGKRRNAESAIDVPQIDAWMRQPSKGLTWADFIEATIGWLKLEECFWLLSDTTLVPFKEAAGYKPEPIIIAQPYRMRHVVENGEIVGWVYTDPSGKSWNLLPEQVIHIKGWNPYDPYRGLGDYAAASVASEADWLAGKFNRNLMGNNGDTGPFIIAKQGLPTDAQRDQIISSLREKRHAQLRGEFKPMFLTGDIDVQDPKISSVDAPFISSRIENRHEIAHAFGIPMSMVDVKAAYSIGSASDIYWLITFTCIPTSAKIAGALETLFQRLFGLDLEVLFDWENHPVMQTVRRERLKDADGLFAKGMPVEQINEYLDLGLPEYEGWDVGYVPINLTPVTGEEAEAVQEPLKPDDFSEDQNPNKGDEESDAVKNLRRLFSVGRGSCRAVERKPENESLWKRHMQRRAGTVRLLQSKASKVFNDYRAKALKRLEAARRSPSPGGEGASRTGKRGEGELVSKSLIDVIFNTESFGAALNAALKPALNAALETSVSDLMAEIGRSDDPWTMPPTEALKFIKSRQNKLSGVADTAHDQLKTAWEESVKAGENVDELADRVRGVFNNLSRYEARRIAMTETCALDGFARHAGMVGAGIQFKSWLSSHGPHVRPAHEAAEARYEAHPIPVDEPFEVGGEALMYPGDESGSPGNVINCQCIQLAAANPKETDET